VSSKSFFFAPLRLPAPGRPLREKLFLFLFLFLFLSTFDFSQLCHPEAQRGILATNPPPRPTT